MNDELFDNLRRSELVTSKGETFTDFRRNLEPRWGKVWRHIISGWLALVLVCLAIAVLSGRHFLQDIVLTLIGSILIGFIIAYLQLFLHEAAHYNIHPDRRLNDLLCNVAVSGIVGQDVRRYRPIHWDHHRHHGTPMDTEISYFDPLSLRFVVESLLGIRAVKVASLRASNLKARDEGKRPGSIPWVLLFGLLSNGALLTLFASLGQWILGLAWIGGLLAWFPFFGAVRQVLEHRDELADPDQNYTQVAHGAIHRLFGDGLLASTLGGAGFNRHLLHHWDPQLSYTRLGDLEHFLEETQAADYLESKRTTYVGTFVRLFRMGGR